MKYNVWAYTWNGVELVLFQIRSESQCCRLFHAYVSLWMPVWMFIFKPWPILRNRCFNKTFCFDWNADTVQSFEYFQKSDRILFNFFKKERRFYLLRLFILNGDRFKTTLVSQCLHTFRLSSILCYLLRLFILKN